MTSELEPLPRSESLAGQAYHAIREGIATGNFTAGERVTERALAVRLGVSPTPIREALRRLEQEGLIERVSHRQLRVVDHSADALRELLFTGAVLRALEARFASAKITDGALDRMEALVDRLERRPALANADYLHLAREFDLEIERAADNAPLRNLILSLSIMGQERRSRSVQSLRLHPEVAAQRVQGHRDVLEALRSRDADRVEKTFRDQAVAGVELLLGDLS
jgi:DNA-binding GntR family transcriptional regulator